MNIKATRERLRQLSHAAKDLAERVGTSEGPPLSTEDKDLIRMSGMSLLWDLKYSYLMGSISDFNKSASQLREIMEL